jgi:hypothetical protein
MAAPPTIGGGSNQTISFSTKDGKRYSNVTVSVTDTGLSVLTSDGGTTIPYNELSDSLSEFPASMRDLILKKRQAAVAQDDTLSAPAENPGPTNASPNNLTASPAPSPSTPPTLNTPPPLFKSIADAVGQLTSMGCEFKRKLVQTPDVPRYKLEKFWFLAKQPTPISIEIGLINGRIASAYFREDGSQESSGHFGQSGPETLMTQILLLTDALLTNPLPEAQKGFVLAACSKKGSNLIDSTFRIVNPAYEIKVDGQVQLDICTPDASPVGNIRQLYAVASVSTGSAALTIDPNGSSFTLNSNGHPYVPTPSASSADPHQYMSRTPRSNSNNDGVLDRESSSSGLDSINVLHSESISDTSGSANSSGYSRSSNPYTGSSARPAFVSPTDEAVDFLNWISGAIPTTPQDAIRFDKEYWTADAAYNTALSQEAQQLQAAKGEPANITWKEDLDDASLLPLSPHDKDMLNLKKQVVDLASSYGRYYSVTIVRKLKPEDFKGLATPGTEIYDVTVTGLSPIQYRQRDATTNNPVNNQPLRLSALSFMQYQHSEALLVTTQTSFTSSGEAEVLCRLGDKAKVTMNDGFDADVPVLIEVPADAQVENKIVELEDKLRKN